MLPLSVAHKIIGSGYTKKQQIHIHVTYRDDITNTFIFDIARVAVFTVEWVHMTHNDVDDIHFLYYSIEKAMDHLYQLHFENVNITQSCHGINFNVLGRLFMMISCDFHINGSILTRTLHQKTKPSPPVIFYSDIPLLYRSMKNMRANGMCPSQTVAWMINRVVHTVSIKVIVNMRTDWAYCLIAARRALGHKKFRRHFAIKGDIVFVLMMALRVHASSMLKRALRSIQDSSYMDVDKTNGMEMTISLPMSTRSGEDKRLQYRYIKKSIGKGTYGTVHMARDCATGRIVAIKRTILGDPNKDFIEYTSKCQSVSRELDLLMRTDHPNIVRMLDHYRIRNRVYIVMEYFPMDLLGYMRSLNQKRIPEGEALLIVRKVMLGLAYLHSMGFIHRDISSRNIMVSEDLTQVKIIDFGLSRFIPNTKNIDSCVMSPRHTECVTGLDMTRTCNNERLSYYFSAYFPEEVWTTLNGEMTYDERVDTWELGVMFLHILLGEFPVPIMKNELDSVYKKIMLRVWYDMLGHRNEKNDPVEFRSPLWKNTSRSSNGGTTLEAKLSPVNASQDTIKMIRSMLIYGRTKRPTVRTLLNKPYFL